MSYEDGRYTKEPGQYFCLTFAHTLRAVRTAELLVSQQELAGMLSVLGAKCSGSLVSKWESGHKYPPDAYRGPLARFLRTSITSLFGDYDAKYRAEVSA